MNPASQILQNLSPYQSLKMKDRTWLNESGASWERFRLSLIGSLSCTGFELYSNHNRQHYWQLCSFNLLRTWMNLNASLAALSFPCDTYNGGNTRFAWEVSKFLGVDSSPSNMSIFCSVIKGVEARSFDLVWCKSGKSAGVQGYTRFKVRRYDYLGGYLLRTSSLEQDLSWVGKKNKDRSWDTHPERSN